MRGSESLVGTLLARFRFAARRPDSVADVAQGMNKRRIETQVHLPAESSNENLHCSCVILVFALPNAFAKLCPGENAPGLLHKDLQDIKLTW